MDGPAKNMPGGVYQGIRDKMGGGPLWIPIIPEDSGQAAVPNKKMSQEQLLKKPGGAKEKKKGTKKTTLYYEGNDTDDGDDKDDNNDFSVYEFNYKRFKGKPNTLESDGDFVYAPYRYNPLYLKIGLYNFNTFQFDGWEEETTEKGGGSDGGTEVYYISLAFIRDLAHDKIDWSQIRARAKYDAYPYGLEQDARELKKMEFMRLAQMPEAPDEEETENNKEISDKCVIPLADNVRVPFRSSAGKLYWGRVDADFTKKQSVEQRIEELFDIKGLFYQIWEQVMDPADGEFGASFRPRYQNIDLGFPLSVVCTPGKMQGPLGFNNEHEVKDFMKKAIGKANEYSKKHTGTFLEYMEQEKPGMILISENPFGLYKVYITEDHHKKYMKSLETSTKATEVQANNTVLQNTQIQPMRKLPTNAQLEELQKHVEDTKKSRKDLSTTQKGGIEAINQHCTQAKCDNYQTVLKVPVSGRKLGLAKNKRTANNAPGKVLGMSASRCAKIYLGWESLGKLEDGAKKQETLILSNGLYMAEWLHLSAFSWGGLLGLPTEENRVTMEQHETSDVPGNLVLGSSETNSQMTRYEKAWQDLVRDECILNSNFDATLHIVRNPMENNTCQVQTDVIKLDKDQIPPVFRRGSDTIHATDGRLTKAAEMNFLAYAISYELEVTKPSYILGPNMNRKLKTIFYPFLRPFFHTLEHRLDAILYKQMKDKVKEPAAANSTGQGTAQRRIDLITQTLGQSDINSNKSKGFVNTGKTMGPFNPNSNSGSSIKNPSYGSGYLKSNTKGNQNPQDTTTTMYNNKSHPGYQRSYGQFPQTPNSMQSIPFNPQSNNYNTQSNNYNPQSNPFNSQTNNYNPQSNNYNPQSKPFSQTNTFNHGNNTQNDGGQPAHNPYVTGVESIRNHSKEQQGDSPPDSGKRFIKG